MQQGYTLDELRDIALGAARSGARKLGLDLEQQSADDLLTILDELARVQPDLLASQWYAQASQAQIRLFKREWAAWLREQQRMMQPVSCLVHDWNPLSLRPGWFSCARCQQRAACPVCLGLGDQGTPPQGAQLRYCPQHLAGGSAPTVPEHQHVWLRLPGAVGLFGCTQPGCQWYAVCCGCLNSIEAALKVQRGIPGMVLYWCPEHDGSQVRP